MADRSNVSLVMGHKLRSIYDAQNGLCFHCDKHMLRGEAILNYYDLGWTREHVYPRSKYNLHNNIVLAHPPCNNRKGSRDPTPAEIDKATAVYAAIGLIAFKGPAAAARALCRAAHDHAAAQWPPKLGELWPRRTKPKMDLKVTPDGVQWVERGSEA